MTQKQAVISGVTSYVQRQYDGDWMAAFDAEDADRDGRLGSTEVMSILAKAGVGDRLTRWMIAPKVIDALDGNGDGFIDRLEFKSLIQATPPGA